MSVQDSTNINDKHV